MLFHVDVQLPDDVLSKVPRKISEIHYSNHAFRKASNRGIILPGKIQNFDVIEVELEGKRLNKFMIRSPYNENFDLCMVFQVQKKSLLCITVWLNGKWDAHNTLDVTRYYRGENGRSSAAT